MGLFGQQPHGLFQPLERQRKHAVADELLDDADALAVLPYALRLRVDPCKLRKRVGEALQPLVSNATATTMAALEMGVPNASKRSIALF